MTSFLTCKRVHTVIKICVIFYLLYRATENKKTYRRRFRRKKIATAVTAITRRDPEAMAGYKIIAEITCFSVEDGMGISTEREREKGKKSTILVT